MKFFIPSLATFAAACTLQADPAADEGPRYVDEAPLPAGWPQPGPYDEVAEKSYPAYRAAFTDGKGESGAFWTLFLHIKKNEIPMTAPVEMPLAEREGGLRQDGMAFLYQSGEVEAQKGAGRNVEIRDVPEAKVLSYAWQGTDSKQNIALARERLVAGLDARGITGEPTFRLLGYNGPGTPRSKRTWELQVALDR